MAIPGGSEPDFGPANVNPGPREDKPDTVVDTTAPKVSLKLGRKVKLSALLRGLRVPYKCSETCSVRGSLSLDRSTAKRLGLPAKVGKGSRSASSAGGTLVVKVSPTAKRKLRARRTVKLTLALRAQDGPATPPPCGGSSRRGGDGAL